MLDGSTAASPAIPHASRVWPLLCLWALKQRYNAMVSARQSDFTATSFVGFYFLVRIIEEFINHERDVHIYLLTARLTVRWVNRSVSVSGKLLRRFQAQWRSWPVTHRGADAASAGRCQQRAEQTVVYERHPGQLRNWRKLTSLQLTEPVS